jgi:heme a synthase
VSVALLLWLVYRLRRTGWWSRLESEVGTLLFVAVLQGTVGYVQYFSGVPAFLVLVHVIGAVSVWIAALSLLLAMYQAAGEFAAVDHVESRSSTA